MDVPITRQPWRHKPFSTLATACKLYDVRRHWRQELTLGLNAAWILMPRRVPRVNVLFICGKNRLRSPTAEQVFASWPGVETSSAGVGNDADVLVDAELLDWADLIFVMEPVHRRKLTARFRSELASKRVVCLDIPDDFDYMAPELIELLQARVRRFLPA